VSVRLLAFVDAGGFGGAELFLGHLLGALPPEVEVAVAGPVRETVASIARHRPGSRAFTVTDGSLRAHLRVIAAVRPDVVHVNQPHPFAARSALTASLLFPRTATVIVDHLPTGSAQRRRTVLERRLLARRASGHVAVGRAAARAVEREVGLPAGRVTAIANGVPRVGPPAPAGAAPARVSPGPVIGGVGRLTTQKGFDLLVAALPSLPETSLVLVGDGPERAALEAQAARLGVSERMHVTGWTDRARDWLPTFDVFALPSRHEGMPLSILEAMHAGLPVVAADVGSVAEAVVDGVTGRVVPREDGRALLVALRDLVADPDRARALGDAGRARALRDHTAEVMARRYLEVYRAAAVAGAH
jgi:glycosyltransferase involved in cell wall biosynthesis